MDFVKKHYEKIILGAVLLGLVGALVFLPVLISGDQQKLFHWSLHLRDGTAARPSRVTKKRALWCGRRDLQGLIQHQLLNLEPSFSSGRHYFTLVLQYSVYQNVQRPVHWIIERQNVAFL